MSFSSVWPSLTLPGSRHAARQIAAIDGHLRLLARLDGRRLDGVDPRRGADAQAIEVIRAAQAIGEAEHADEVLAIGRQRRVQQSVVVAIIAAQAERRAAGAEQLEGHRQPAIDARGQAAANDALALLAGEDVIVHIGRRLNNAIDDGIERNSLRLVGVVVGLLLVDLVEIADDERPRIADAALA